MTSLYEKVIWHFETNSPVDRPPTVAGNSLYFGKEENLYAVDIDSGTEQWCFSADEIIQGSPVVVNGMVYFDTSDGHTHAVDADTGAEKWRHRVGHNGGATEPAVTDGIVYTVAGSSFDQQIHAIDAELGQVLWKFGLKRENDDRGVISHPLKVANSTIYFMSDSGILYAVDTETQEMKWSLDGFPHMSSHIGKSYPTIVDGNIYLGCRDGLYKIGTKKKRSALSFLSTSAGKIKWSYEDGWFLSPIATSNGTIYATERMDKKLYAFNSDGEIKWQTALPGQDALDNSPPRLENGKIYVSSKDVHDYLIVIDGDSGQQLERIRISRDTLSGMYPPLVHQGIAYIGGFDGLRAVDINSQKSPSISTETSQDTEPNSVIRCSKCGTENDPEDVFCKNADCGQKLN